MTSTTRYTMVPYLHLRDHPLVHYRHTAALQLLRGVAADRGGVPAQQPPGLRDDDLLLRVPVEDLARELDAYRPAAHDQHALRFRQVLSRHRQRFARIACRRTKVNADVVRFVVEVGGKDGKNVPRYIL